MPIPVPGYGCGAQWGLFFWRRNILKGRGIMLDKKTFDAVVSVLLNSGIEMFIHGAGHGLYHVDTSIADIMYKFVTDKTGFFADFYGVSRKEYIAYLSEDRNHPEKIRCHGITAKGKRCKNVDHSNYNITDIPEKYFAYKHKYYCHLHG